jgi:hypothetical protein
MNDTLSKLKATVRHLTPHLSSEIELCSLNDAVTRVCYATGHHLPKHNDDIEKFALLVINHINSFDL